MSTLREQIEDAIERWVYTDYYGDTLGAGDATDEIMTLLTRETRSTDELWADTGEVHYTITEERYVTEWQEAEE